MCWKKYGGGFVGLGFGEVLKVGTPDPPVPDSERGTQKLVEPSLVPGSLADLKFRHYMEADPKSAGRLGCGNFLILCAGTWLAGGPVGGFVVAGGGELVGSGAIGEHGPNLASATASGFEDDVATVRGPAGAFVAA